MTDPRVSVVVLAYGHQPLLLDAVDSVLASTGVEVDVVLVDNGGAPETTEPAAARPGVRVVNPGRNLGFAAGCNLGAREADGEYLALVNGDAVVDPDALAHMVAALGDDVGLTTASVRLLDQPEVLNTAGNPVHYLGLSWAGGLGRPATDFPAPRDVASASGACAVLRRSFFLELGGLCETLFTYVEDTDLSLRIWQRGLRVVYVPDAVVRHDYEFSRNPDKFYLLERNRLFVVLTLYPARVLLAVAPVLLAAELGLLLVAARGGWLRQKVRGWWWLLRHTSVVRRRRREVTAVRVTDDAAFAALLTARLDPGVEGFAVPAAGQWLLSAWWGLARRTV